MNHAARDDLPRPDEIDRVGREEVALLAEAAVEVGLDPADLPRVSRRVVALAGIDPAASRQLSLLSWGANEADLVLLHGGGQNAHTWDLVLLLLGRPAVAVDLPGHGHSSWRSDRDYGPIRNADAIAVAIERYAPRAAAVIGMSLGGLTTMHLAATRPDLVRRAVLIDITPGTPAAAAAMTAQQRGAVQLARGPRSFFSREEMVNAAVAASPRRPPSAVRRGVIHNSHQLVDGTWAWRYDRPDPALPFPTEQLWDDLARLTMPTLLVTGGDSGFVSAADRTELARRAPAIRVETVARAGHAVQSDQPAALATLIADFAPPHGAH